MSLLEKLKEAFKEAKKSDRSFERALHFRTAMFQLEEELFLLLETMESEEWRDPWWFKEPTPPPVQQIKLHGCELCGNLTCRGTCFK